MIKCSDTGWLPWLCRFARIMLNNDSITVKLSRHNGPIAILARLGECPVPTQDRRYPGPGIRPRPAESGPARLPQIPVQPDCAITGHHPARPQTPPLLKTQGVSQGSCATAARRAYPFCRHRWVAHRADHQPQSPLARVRQVGQHVHPRGTGGAGSVFPLSVISRFLQPWGRTRVTGTFNVKVDPSDFAVRDY